MLLLKDSVLSFEEKKQHNLGLPTFKLPQVLNIFSDYPLKIIFVNFGI